MKSPIQKFTTVADVRDAARIIWPDAATIEVALVHGAPVKTYRVSGFATDRHIVGHVDGPNLSELKAQVERQLRRSDNFR